MPEMKDSGIEWIGEMPKDWDVIRCKYISTFLNGYSFDSRDLKLDFQYPVIRIGDIKGGGIDTVNCQGVDFNIGLERYLIQENDILLAMSGATVGKVGIAHNSDYAYINQRVGIIRTEYPKFLFYCLSAKEFIEYILLHANGSAQPNVSGDVYGEYCISYPKIAVRERIANFLDSKCAEIDALTADIEKEIEVLEEYKKSVITEAVTKGLDKNVEMKDSGLDWMKQYPSSWSISRLKYLGTLQNGISKGGEFFGEGYPFVSYGDAYKNITLPHEASGLIRSSLDERVRYSVKKGDAFFTRTSENLEEIGFSSVCEKTIENAVFAGFLIRFRPNNSSINMRFAKYYFRSEKLRLYYVTRMMIVTRASLSQQLLGDMPILIPPIKEQKSIADFLDNKCREIENIIAQKQEQLEVLADYKKSLIYEYVTGKKEVPESY